MTQSATADLEVEGWDGGDLDLGGLSGLLGFHLRMANVALYRDFMSAVGEFDLTQRQAATLFLIGANPGAPQVAIAASLGADRATIMAMVDRLETRGLITRERSKVDRRRQELHLTKRGETVYVEVRKRIFDHEAMFASRLKPEEFQTLIALLTKLHK
jgi:DNA-binding MarR family transcriptional regulator